MEHSSSVMDPAGLTGRVASLIEQGRPGAARPLMAAMRTLLPMTPERAELAGRLALLDGVMDGAETDLDAAIAEHPVHVGLRKCRAELRRRGGDIEGAARDAAEAVIADRNDPVAKALLGALMLDLGQPRDAASCLREAVLAVPRDASYREALSQALMAQNEPDAALAVLLDGIAANPGSAAIRNAAILLSIRLRDFTGAEALAEDTRLAGAADAATFGLKGHALSSLGRHADAAAAYQEALKLAPGDAYVRHLAAASGIAAAAPRAPDDYVRTLFDGYADGFEAHIVSLGYRIPGLMRRCAAGLSGPVLDLGCGTGLTAVALSDSPLGPFTGIDISPRMAAHARAKGLYDRVIEAALPEALHTLEGTWPLIAATDLVCYFGALAELLSAVRDRLTPEGRFIFSVEELVPDHDGHLPGNGYWALGRMGRYGHAEAYLRSTAEAADLRCLTLQREVLRQEAGGPVAGFMVVLQRPETSPQGAPGPVPAPDGRRGSAAVPDGGSGAGADA